MSAAMPHLPAYAETLRRQALMDEMMERCSVDVVELIRSDRASSFAEARARCRLCGSVRTCRDWLLAADGEGPPDFCPNACLFRIHLTNKR